MLNKLKLRAYDIQTWPTVAISIVMALVLMFFGIYVMIPADWLGIIVTSIYPSQLVRTLFGLLIVAPSIPLLYWNIRYDLRTYIQQKRPKARIYMFWMGVTFFYLCAIRILALGWFPPVWLLYLALGLISMILWMEGKH